ncbi:MAG TPA: hypothetical protein QGF05_02370, partial [Dehalococcoidia bacterium]|nr:hypothetical protein [Dehalococcoidia bacterium]
MDSFTAFDGAEDDHRSRRRRRRSGATDAVDGIMEAAFGDRVRGDGFIDPDFADPVRGPDSGRRRKSSSKQGSKQRREAQTGGPQPDEPGPLWLVDAARMRSLPSPSGPR